MKKKKSIFSQKLIQLRKANGMTQAELAHELNTTRDLIAYYESKMNNPTVEILKMLASFFNISPSFFLDEMPKKVNHPGPQSKLEKQIQLLRKLPKKKQQAVSTMIEMAIQSESV